MYGLFFLGLSIYYRDMAIPEVIAALQAFKAKYAWDKSLFIKDDHRCTYGTDEHFSAIDKFLEDSKNEPRR